MRTLFAPSALTNMGGKRHDALPRAIARLILVRGFPDLGKPLPSAGKDRVFEHRYRFTQGLVETHVLRREHAMAEPHTH